MAKFFIGTAGWSYKDWVPSFYPKNQTQGFDWLQFYARYFNCVEVNASYYTYLSPRTVESWIEKLSDAENFIFTLKLHQDFTHKKNYDKQKIKAVLYNLDKLAKAERLGGLLLQFPYSFQCNEINIDYIKQLKEIFQNFNCFVEVRHKSWMNKKTIELFKELDLTYCSIDQPEVGEAIPFEPIITNDKAYIRFHGRNKEAWIKSINNFGKKQNYQEQSARYKYLYSPSELLEIQEKILSIKEAVKEIFVIMNNHPNGDAVANAFELIYLLEEKLKIQMPDNILMQYPRLQKIASN